MASGLDQLAKLMQLQQMANAGQPSAFDQQKFAYQRQQDAATQKRFDREQNRLSSKIALDKLTGEELKAKARKQQEFSSIYNTNIPHLLEAYKDDRGGFITEAGALGADYPEGVPENYLQNTMSLYDSVQGKRPSGRGNVISHVEREGGGTEAVYIPQGGNPDDILRFPTVATASTQLTQDPTNRGNITGQIEMSKLEVKELEDLRKNAWEGVQKSFKAEQDVNQMEAVLKDFNPGPGVSFRMIPQVIKDYIGLTPNKDYTSLQVFESFVGQGMLAARDPKGEVGGLPGATSDRDLDVLRSIVANTKMPADAIKIMLNFKKQEIIRRKKMYQITNSHRGTSSELKDSLVEYLEANPYKILDVDSVRGFDDMSDEELLNF